MPGVTPTPNYVWGAWRRVAGVIALAVVGVGAVLLASACSIGGALPTLVPTRALPTAEPGTATPAAGTAAALPPFSKEGALVLSYDLDPTSGQMVPADRLSGVTVEASDELWVMTDNAFVEYHRAGPEELVAFKIITYTYDTVGRRVGWTVSWPQGPTQTQQLLFLYEGLVAVGERLQVGALVTTTYYPWATQDRNTTVDDMGLALVAPITDVTRYDARCEAAAEMDCVTMMAKIVVSEASVGNEQEQRAVAWTFRNRLDRGLALLSYAMDRTPDREWYYELAREVLTSPAEADVTEGATHFFSPRSMPLQGEEARCKPTGAYDCDGGLVFVEGLDAPAYAPFWHLLYEWLPVEGIRKTHFLFYRIPPIRPRVGSQP
jgi:hypothetical protein